jgi:tetratricopeptide (TPR) repeat protein
MDADARDPRRERRSTLLAALGLVLAVVAVYWPVRTHGFVAYDDEVYLTGNPHVRKGLDWDEIVWVFGHEHAANYHPVTWLAHMLDVELFGLAPGPHHLVDVALHALNACLVLLLARALLASPWAAALAAALFALHPLRVESVAWASEKKDVLCATFYLAGLLLYLRYGRAPSLGRYLLVALALALALLSKPMAVTFPFVALLLDVWPLRRLALERPFADAVARRVWLEKLPLLVLAALGAVSTWFAQEVGGAASGTQAVPFGLRVLNALASYGVYLRETFQPTELAVFHPLAAIVAAEPRAELIPAAALALLVLGGTSWLAWRARRRMPWFLLGWCWYLGLLVPVLGLKQVGAQAHADRYTYLPLIGVAWIVAGLARELVGRWPRLRWPAAGFALACIAALAVRTRSQLATWRDTRSLFEHALAVEEKSYVAHAGLGAYYLEQGERERARAHLEAALAIDALDATALTTLGRMELDAGNLAAAEQYLLRAKQVHASKWVRYHVGRLKLHQGNLAAAAREFGAALELDPSLVDARFNLGQTLFQLGRKSEARACFADLQALDPRHAGAWNGLGVLALEAGEIEEAERCFRRAVELDPRYADAVNNLGVALERQGRASEASELYEQARELRAGQGARQ